jgi:HEAT repeat protein
MLRTEQYVRDAAASLLVFMNVDAATPKVLAHLRELVQDRESDAHSPALQALLGLAWVNTECAEILLEIGRTGSNAVRATLVSMLGECEFPKVMRKFSAFVLDVSRDDSPRLRDCCVGALARLASTSDDPAALIRLLELSRDKDENLRRLVVMKLGRMKAEPAPVEVMVRLLELSREQNPRIREDVAEAFTTLGWGTETGATLARLVELTADEDQVVREKAVTALGQAGERTATPTTLMRLLQLSQEQDQAVREKAVAALGQIGPRAATPATLARLKQLIQQPTGDLRICAAEALGRMGSAALDKQAMSLLAEFWCSLLQVEMKRIFLDGEKRVRDKALMSCKTWLRRQSLRRRRVRIATLKRLRQSIVPKRS